MKLEVIVAPVSNVDRVKQFYKALGWRLDADFVANAQFRVELVGHGTEVGEAFHDTYEAARGAALHMKAVLR